MPERQLVMLTTLGPEVLLPADHPITALAWWSRWVELDGETEAMHIPLGSSEHPTRAAVEGDRADGALLHPQRTGVP
ncbi:MAG: hypothetical protein J2P57_13140 [Acidimicrobiaceae bacterium]|nr:hypothetical protein [Acidimicrobiaceae bacterium]